MDTLSPELAAFLNAALPIVLGALIGYVTNMIAIRMLFRPLKEYRIFGLRIPFTPGIIPRQRYILARNIGEMVSGELLNREAIIGHLRNPAFREGLAGKFREALSAAGDTGAGLAGTAETSGAGLAGTGPGADGAGVADGTGVADGASGAQLSGDGDFASSAGPAAVLVAGALRSALRKADLESVLARVSTDLGSSRLSEVLPAGLTDGSVESFVDRQLVSGLGPALVGLVRDQVVAARRNNLAPARLLNDQLVSSLFGFVASIWEPVVKSFVGWLRRPENRRELTVRGKEILRGIIQQLTTVQRFLLSAGQYDKTLEEKMPAIVSGLLQTLEQALLSHENRDRIFAALRETVDGALALTISQIEGETGFDLAEVSASAASRILSNLAENRLGQATQEKVREFLKRHGDLQLRVLVRFLSGRRPEHILADFGQNIRTWSEEPGKLERLVQDVLNFVLGQVRESGAEQTGSGAAATADRSEGSEFGGLTNIAINSLEQVLPQLVESLDIRALVENRINSLDVADVEKLLLSILAKHLKWINLFGGLLGAFIGALQLFMK